MKLPQTFASGATLAALLLLLSQHLTYAVPLKPKAIPCPYKITLSCLANTNSWSPDIPYIAIDLTNSTSRTLFFSYAPGIDPNFVVFAIEYKTTTENPFLSSGWIRLSPNAEPISNQKSLPPGLITEEITNQQRVVILPGQEQKLSFSPEFTMSKIGLYRITAVMTVPKASEYNGRISPSTKVRSFELLVRSKPFIIRRTVDGFVSVDTTAGKPVAPS